MKTNNIFSVLILANLILLCSACISEQVYVPYFRYKIPNQSEIDACTPSKGGTKESCMAISAESRMGVALAYGIGKKFQPDDAPLTPSKIACVVIYHENFNPNGTNWRWFTVHAQGLQTNEENRSRDYKKFRDEDLDSELQIRVSADLDQLVQNSQCLF